MFKYLAVLTLTFNLSTSAFGAGVTKLADYLVTGSGVIEILAKYGVKGTDAKQVESYVDSALRALGTSKMTKADLANALSKLPVSGVDATTRKELQLLLDKPEGELKKEDVVKAINNIIYLANRHANSVGKSVFITCIECVNEQLAKDGFKFTVETIKNASAVKVMNEVIPSNPAELNNFISSRMRRLGMGDYSRVTPDAVAPTEEKTLALFLGLAENGSPEQKDLIAAIKKVSTRNGRTNLIDPKNPHKFWKIVTDDMTTEDMKAWTSTLDEIASRAEKENITAEESFYRTLKDKAQGDENLTKQYETLKAKRCFFK